MHLEITNFRGIRHAKLNFPKESRIVCLIGPGDSCKSTILTAIEWVLCPSWNLLATDNDFYNGNIELPIIISASIAEFPEALQKENKFGLFLRDYDKVIEDSEDDEPTDAGTVVLTIQLTIDSLLEPKWEVITKRTETRPISQKDRRLLAFGAVGFEYERDFQWGRHSVLQRYVSSRETLHNTYTEAMRSLVTSTSLNSLDGVVSTLQDVGNRYGVSFTENLHNQLLMQNSSFSTTVGIFDDKVPFSQRGLGSKRLFSIGMNVNAFKDGTLVLIDEVETGLEPYRLSRLINALRDDFSKSGQVIMTTHSTSTICECSVKELVVCRNIKGEVQFRLLNEDTTIEPNVQNLLRREPGAFLCQRVIVCEGKTEIGLLRAFDRIFLSNHGKSFASYGVGIALGGGGDNFIKLAKQLKRCGYAVSLLMDSDIQSEDSWKQEVEALGIPVFSWETGNAIEEQIFHDGSVRVAQKLLEYAIEEKSFDHVKSKMLEHFSGINKPFIIRDDSIILQQEISQEQLKAIGTIAKHKKSEWYKRIDHGEYIGNIVFSYYNDFLTESGFMKVIANLRKWVICNEG